ncbi:heliorhodopsin HeR [Candidatus Saccharibacteria bacterium]|nr:heliorhodopsin HeR [Candidatus Saccharibacteria bacterium]
MALKKATPASLKRFNLIMATLHAGQALVMSLIAKVDVTFPVTVSFLKFDIASRTLKPATEKLFDLPLVYPIIGFLILSSLFHLLIATIGNKSYNNGLKKGINAFRWVEYSLSASTMMVAIAFLVGVYDLSSLIMIFALTAIMNLLGLVMEVHNQTTAKTNWLSYWLGCLAGIIPWVVVGLYFWASATYGPAEAKIPTFVYWIYVSIFAFFNCFAINMVLQYKKVGKWSDYLYGERAYIILSLVAKSALAWQVFAGTLRP